jgi:hypothetical protein
MNAHSPRNHAGLFLAALSPAFLFRLLAAGVHVTSSVRNQPTGLAKQLV